MSEAALWLNYGLSGIVAFLIIYFRRWRIVPAMLVGTGISLALYLVASLATGGALDDPWLAPALFINGCFALVAAFLGAAIAFAASQRGDGR